MKKTALFIAIMFIFSSCYDVTGPEEEELLLGSWLLVRVSGGFDGQTTEVNPSDGNKMVISVGGSVSYYSKSVLQRRTTFVVKKSKSIYSNEEKNFIHFADRPEVPMVIMMVSRDTLQLADNMYDGYSFTYLKEK